MVGGVGDVGPIVYRLLGSPVDSRVVMRVKRLYLLPKLHCFFPQLIAHLSLPLGHMFPPPDTHMKKIWIFLYKKAYFLFSLILFKSLLILDTVLPESRGEL